VIHSRIESLGVSYPRNGRSRIGSLKHATRAGKECFKASNYLPADIEVMINAGVNRDRHYAEPAFACFIQKSLNINIEFQERQTLSFDLQNGGCGLLNALHVLTTLMQSGAIRVGMAIASETNTDRSPDPSYTVNESGTAVLLDIAPAATEGFSSFVFRTFGEYCDLYESVVSLAQKNGRLYVRKKEELEETWLSLVPAVWEELLDNDQISRDEIDFLFPSQISSEFIARLSKNLDFPDEKIVNVFDRFGDTLTTSPFVALQYMRDLGRIESDQKIAFLTVGSGLTIGAAAYDY
jgi:3-oxoacyl-[acyl-carrier-protein] synthase-3